MVWTQTRIGARAAALTLGTALAIGCVPGPRLEDSSSCEEGVRTTNPYDFRWTLKIEKARIDPDGAGGLPHNPVRFETHRAGGDHVFSRSGWDHYEMNFSGEYASVYFDSSTIFSGTLEELMGGTLDAVGDGTATPPSLELWDDGGWVGRVPVFGWDNPLQANELRAACPLRISPAAYINAANREVPIIIGNRLESDPEDAIVLSTETVACPWLLHAEFSVEAEINPDRRDDIEIEPSGNCSSLRAADAYDYEMIIGEVNLDPSNPDLSDHDISEPYPMAALTYQGRWIDAVDGEQAEDYEEYEFWAEGYTIDPRFYLHVGNVRYGGPDASRPGLQVDHLAGESEHKVNLRIFDYNYPEGGDDDFPSNNYVYLDCDFDLNEEQLLTSVNREGDRGPDESDRWIQIGPGNGLDCTGDDRTSRGLIDGDESVAIALTPHLKWDIGDGEIGDGYFTDIDFPQEHPEGESEDLEDAEAGPAGYDPDGPDRCQPTGGRAYNCTCPPGASTSYFTCVEDGAVPGDTLEAEEEPEAEPEEEEPVEEDVEDVEEPEVEDGPSPDDPEECCMAEGGCSEGVIPTGACAEEAADETPCDPDPCGENGTCEEDDTAEGDYKCNCEDGYSDDGASCVEEAAECTGNTEVACCANPDACCLENFEESSCEQICTGGDTRDECCANVNLTCCIEDFDASSCTEAPDISDDDDDDDSDDISADDPGTGDMQEISGCACSGSDASSSRGTALLLLVALGLMTWRRRRRTI